MHQTGLGRDADDWHPQCLSWVGVGLYRQGVCWKHPPGREETTDFALQRQDQGSERRSDFPELSGVQGIEVQPVSLPRPWVSNAGKEWGCKDTPCSRPLSGMESTAPHSCKALGTG